MAFKKYSRAAYNPLSDKPYKLSRSRIDNYLNCPRCFYMEERKKIKAPSGPTFTLNNAVDNLYKNEFDLYRKEKKPHPIMIEHNLECIPYDDEKLPEWRNAFKGIQYHDKKTNLIFFGGIDDIWINNNGELHIVDYKATAKKTFNPNFDTGWEICYKRQIEIYQWLFKKNGFNISNIGYIIYANGKSDEKEFDGKLTFDQHLYTLACNTDWIDKIIPKIYECLNSDNLPKTGGGWNGEGCEQCNYKKQLAEIFKQHLKINSTQK